MSKTKYGLLSDMHDATRGHIFSVDVFYDIDTDKLSVTVAERRDVTDEELLKRVANQIEHSLRDKSAFYALELQRIEQLAGVSSASSCGCRNEHSH